MAMKPYLAFSYILWFASGVASIEMDIPDLGCKICDVFGIHAVILLVLQAGAFLLSWNAHTRVGGGLGGGGETNPQPA